MRTRTVILAGGVGSRIASLGVPKPLVVLDGTPLVEHVLRAALASGVDERPLVIVSPATEAGVRAALGDRCDYALQSVPNGTGDAVRQARSALESTTDFVIVLYADQPFIRSETIRRLRDHALEHDAILTMLTARVPDFSGWRTSLYDFGRIIRDDSGAISRIVEKRDATSDELLINEVNPSIFCFSASWLWAHLEQLKPVNTQGEYYLTDLVQIVAASDSIIRDAAVDCRETFGINTPEHLKLARALAAVEI